MKCEKCGKKCTQTFCKLDLELGFSPDLCSKCFDEEHPDAKIIKPGDIKVSLQ